MHPSIFTQRLMCVGVVLALLGVAGVAPAAAEPGKHLFILSGQSNMRNPLISTFTETVKRVFGEDRVIVAHNAHPSQPIHRWYKQWEPPAGEPVPDNRGVLYDRLMGVVNRAIKDQMIATVTFVWMQGEADAQKGWAEPYERAFFGVLDQLRNDLDHEPINFVIGRINDHYLNSRGLKHGDEVRAVQQKIGEASEHGTWINTDDLNTGVNPWGGFSFADGHFPNTGYRVLGQRFARAAVKLADPTVQLDEAIFDAVHFDSAALVKTHAAVGKTISDPGGAAGPAKLLDNQRAANDPYDPNWQVFDTAGKAIELVIDLGEAAQVEAVAFNVLINHYVSAHLPRQVLLAVSTDGEKYEQVGRGRKRVAMSVHRSVTEANLAKDFEPRVAFFLYEKKLKARYLKLTFTPETRNNGRLMIDEIMVNPVLK